MRWEWDFILKSTIWPFVLDAFIKKKTIDKDWFTNVLEISNNSCRFRVLIAKNRRDGWVIGMFLWGADPHGVKKTNGVWEAAGQNQETAHETSLILSRYDGDDVDKEWSSDWTTLLLHCFPTCVRNEKNRSWQVLWSSPSSESVVFPF